MRSGHKLAVDQLTSLRLLQTVTGFRPNRLKETQAKQRLKQLEALLNPALPKSFPWFRKVWMISETCSASASVAQTLRRPCMLSDSPASRELPSALNKVKKQKRIANAFLRIPYACFRPGPKIFIPLVILLCRGFRSPIQSVLVTDMPPSGLNVDKIWQSLNTNTGKRGGITSLAGLPGVLTHSRTLPLDSPNPGPPADDEQPVKVVGPAIDELTTKLQVSTADRDQLWVIMQCKSPSSLGRIWPACDTCMTHEGLSRELCGETSTASAMQTVARGNALYVY